MTLHPFSGEDKSSPQPAIGAKPSPSKSGEGIGVNSGGGPFFRPKAIDLFCCAGGASAGLHRAGLDVTGYDIRPQPRYPFTFVLGDALEADLSGADFVWASPPCQAHTALRTMHNAKPHPDLIPATREKLEAWGGPWVMENVVGAPLRNPVTLCGTMFGLGCSGAELRRHRLFETSLPFLLAPPCHHRESRVIGVYGGHGRDRRRLRNTQDFSTEHRREAMGIDWMTGAELSQAIPPAYSEFFGKAFMRQIFSREGGAK